MDVFLLVASIVLSIVLLLSSFYILAVYCHPEDKGFGAGNYCKVIVICSITLSWALILIFPLDISNSRGEGVGADMHMFWIVMLMILVGFIAILIPNAILFYETDDECSMKSRIFSTICQHSIALLVAGVITFGSFPLFRFVDIPVTVTYGNVDMLTNSKSTLTKAKIATNRENRDLEMDVNVPLYLIACLSFFGWCILSVYGGVGLISFPHKLIMAFVNRPKLVRNMTFI